MKTAAVVLLIWLLTMFAACEQKDPNDPYPVWILYARVVEFESDIGIPYAPVRGCPEVIFRTIPGGNDTVVSCYDQSNLVKVWDHVDSAVTIEYRVQCANYYDSEPEVVTFLASQAVHRPGRDGRETIRLDTVILAPR